MPAPGEQHNGIANPFEEAKPRISTYTATEIATLQARLEKQLGPEYLSARSGPSGQKVHYIAAEKCIALANEVFGFNGWSSSIQNIQVDFVDENPQTLKISLGLSVIVRITLRDGTYHEDIGYGHIENCKGKAAAFEKAKKEGTTDALKRALRNFGNVLGNCIYDKDYLAKVTKIKVGPAKFDETNLHRHADFANKKPSVPAAARAPLKSDESGVVGTAAPSGPTPGTASTSLDEEEFGDFDMADFGVTEDGHPDEVMLPASHSSNINDTPANRRPTAMGSNANQHMQPPSKPPVRNGANGPPPPRQPQTPNQAPQRPPSVAQNRPGVPAQNQPPRPQGGQRPMPGPPAGASAPAQQGPSLTPGAAPPGAPSEPVAFFSARSVVPLAEDAPPGTATVPAQGAKLFDAKLESPSIRKTPGIDHNTSRPLARNGQHVAPAKLDDDKEAPASPLIGTGRGGFTGAGPGRPSMGMGNPVLSQTRQIGAPMMGGSPMGNRNQYKPPTIKRPAPAAGTTDGGGGGVGIARQALTDVSTNGNVNSIGGAGNDPKRQKMA
ncbi:uncharacterized protein B0I36DRAFT_328993 [Microdochium trichocladiopsis]|uniref:RAD52 homolog n=1 Tax=Microdochium trichocladiopsis TaxID=1682393 RepID=A0A9P8Y195_9PEZI|nr:uncharacterized protein B0I36DRAFT_328993 [Microdochium trichocladiopsis]KAH7025724.1 hypothetical protein B0I36DRAFT_328993 [Microdochium trichocladiopsis]